MPMIQFEYMKATFNMQISYYYYEYETKQQVQIINMII